MFATSNEHRRVCDSNSPSYTLCKCTLLIVLVLYAGSADLFHYMTFKQTLFYPCCKAKYIFFLSKFLVNNHQISIYENRMEQKFLTEALGPDKRSQTFKYLIGEKPNFECHGERLVPSIQFFYGG